MLISSPLPSLAGDFSILTTTFTGDIVPIQVAVPNPERFGILFSGQGSTSWMLNNGGDFATNPGIFMISNVPYLYFNFRDHGPLPTLAWFANQVGAPYLLTVYEILYKPIR